MTFKNHLINADDIEVFGFGELPPATPMPKAAAKISRLLQNKSKVCLDLGGGSNPHEEFIIVDKRKLDCVDIVHDLEIFPWPFPDNCAEVLLISHLLEHIKPWLTIDFMNEAWRVLKPKGLACIATPYAGSPSYWQDPTHINGFTEKTFEYFTPELPNERDSLSYAVYKPKPWKILNMDYNKMGEIKVVMEAIK